MHSKPRSMLVWLILVLFITINTSNVHSDMYPLIVSEPQLTDNQDGNWTAVWSFQNPDNYTLNGTELNNGLATLEVNITALVENSSEVFEDCSSENLKIINNNGIGIDISKFFTTLLADCNNNRVLEIDYNKWIWQYGLNISSGYGSNELNKPSFAIPISGNKILITDTENNRVIEIGQNGEFYWQYGSNTSSGKGENLLNKPSSAVPMANGNILIADSENDYVVEVNRSKKIVWYYDNDLSKPSYAEELSNGSILITDRKNHWIIEVNKNKQIYWQYGDKGKSGTNNRLDTPNFATRLKNGHTLITDTKNERLIEIDASQAKAWQYGVDKKSGYDLNKLTQPRYAIRLPNENTLITDSGNHRVLEVDNTKNWIWQYGTNGTNGVGPNYLDTPNSGLPIIKKELIGCFTSQVLDGSDVTNWTTISWNQSIPLNTQIQLYTRTGDTQTPPTGSWTGWSDEYTNPNGESIKSPNNRYIQYNAFFFTNDINVTPILKNVTICGSRYEPSGELITEFFEPSGLLGWEALIWNVQLNGQIINSYYSTSPVSPWNPVPVDNDLTNVPIDTCKIRFKFRFLTSDTLNSPVLTDFSLIYGCLGELTIINITPTSTGVIVGEQLNFTATGYDQYGRKLTINPVWFTTVGAITNGTLTAQATPGNGFVNATEEGVVGSATVTVLPGSLDHIVVEPHDIAVIAGEFQIFNAIGYDKFNNEVFIAPSWSTNVGIMVDNILHVQNFADTGIVTASVGEIIGNANVTVELNASTHHPPTIITRVPNQLKPEDSEPWFLNLATYEWDEEDAGDKLIWYITDVDENLLTFIPKQNAYGSNMATLWLKDNDNMTTHQQLWVNITPVNDNPEITEAPDIMVHYDEAYVFDYSSYISDIETPNNKLVLTINEPSGQKYTAVNGLNVTYNYPQSMLGKTVEITLLVSDGSATAEDIIKISITDNHAPRLIKNFPDVIMYEGDTRDYLFNLDDHFTDSDGDVLNYSFNARFITIEIHENHSVTISSAVSWSGTEIITFRATDPKSAIAEGRQKITVLEVNDPPQILPIPDLYVHYEYNYKFNLSKYIRDPDNETNELIIWTSDLINITFSISDNALMILYYPAYLLDETLRVVLFVSDGIELATCEFLVHVTDNYPPILEKELTDIYFNEDSVIKFAFDLSKHFTDMDDSNLNYSYKLTDEENLTIVINANNTVDFSSKQDWFGTSTAVFRAKDHSLAFVETEILVVVIPVNDAPAIHPIPTQKGKVGERWVLDISTYLYDVDNDLNDLELSVLTEYTGLVTITGKQFTFHSSKSIDIQLEFVVTDGNLNCTGNINLTIVSKKTEDFSFGIWILISIIILFVIGTIIVTIRKRHGNFIITDFFIIHKDGLLIKYKGNSLNRDLDEDIFSGPAGNFLIPFSLRVF